MSFAIDRYLLPEVSSTALLEGQAPKTVQTQMREAIQRLEFAAAGSYNNISAVSVYWQGDDSGSKEDSELFIETMQKLPSVTAHQFELVQDRATMMELTTFIGATLPPEGSLGLLILHYPGHGVRGGDPASLLMTPTIGHKYKKSSNHNFNLSRIKDDLKAIASCRGLDLLIVVDSCHAAIAGQDPKANGARVELIAATSRDGITNSRHDGRTFTQHWCSSFTGLLESAKPFTCEDVIESLCRDDDLVQFPKLLVLRDGWDFPIMFHPHLRTESNAAGKMSDNHLHTLIPRIVTTTFLVDEAPDKPSLQELINFLREAPVPIEILGVLPVSSTLIILRIPVALQQLLLFPQVILMPPRIPSPAGGVTSSLNEKAKVKGYAAAIAGIWGGEGGWLPEGLSKFKKIVEYFAALGCIGTQRAQIHILTLFCPHLVSAAASGSAQFNYQPFTLPTIVASTIASAH